MEVDPYVLGVIRLADRRGLLTGRVSRVQEWMLQVLMLQESSLERDRIEMQRYDQARAALLVAQPLAEQAGFNLRGWMDNLYPEFSQKDEVEEIRVTDITDEDLEDSTGGWDFTTSAVTAEEIQDVLQAMGQNGQVRLSDVDDGGWV